MRPRLLFVLLLLSSVSLANAAILTPESPVSAPMLGAAHGGQFAPALTTNGKDFFAAWTDTRFGGRDVLGTRIDADARVLDAHGIALRPTGYQDHTADAVWNGSSYIVVHASEHIGVNAVDVMADGKVLGGVAIVVPRWVFDVEIAWSGSAYLVTWSDQEAGVNARVFDSDLRPVGQELHFGPGWRPVVASNGSGFLVAWNRAAGENWSSTFTLVSTSGVAGERVIFTDRSTTDLAVASNGTGYLLMHGGGPGSEALAISSDGEITHRTQLGDVRSPAVTWDGVQYVAAWSAITSRLIGAAFDASGTLTREPVRLLTQETFQMEPAIAATSEAILVAWTERDHIRGMRYTPETYALNPVDTPSVLLSTDAAAQTPLDAVWAGSRLSVLWREGDLGDGRLVLDGADVGRGQRGAIAANGETVAIASLADQQPFVRVAGRGPALKLDDRAGNEITIAGDGSEFAVLWSTGAPPANTVKAAKIDAAGTVTAAPRVVFADTDSHPMAIVWTGTEYAVLIADYTYRQVGRFQIVIDADLYLLRLDRSLSEVAPPRFLRHVPYGGYYPYDLATSGRDLMLVWIESTSQSRLAGQRLALDGTALDAPVLFTEPEFLVSPHVAWKGDAYVITAGDFTKGAIWEGTERTTIPAATNLILAAAADGRVAVIYSRPVAVRPDVPDGLSLRAFVRRFAGPKVRSARK